MWIFQKKYSWPLNNVGVRDTNPPTVQKLRITYSQSSVYAVPPHPQFHLLGFNHHRSCTTVVFTTEDTPHVSGPAQFKPALFKGQPNINFNIHGPLGRCMSSAAGWIPRCEIARLRGTRILNCDACDWLVLSRSAPNSCSMQTHLEKVDKWPWNVRWHYRQLKGHGWSRVAGFYGPSIELLPFAHGMLRLKLLTFG